MYNSDEEKKRAETEIFNLSKFPEENPNPILRVKQDGVILYANSSSAPLLKLWKSKVGKRLPQPYLNIITRTFQTRKPETVEIKCYGRTYSLLFVPVTDTDYVNLYGRDITEIRQAEESLRKSEENFRRSIDDSPLGIRIVDDDGETLYANRAILDIYGYENIDELKNTPVKERYTPESYAEHKLRKQKRQRNEYAPLEYEVSIVRKNGETRHLEVFRKGVLWNGKKHFQSIYKDITERKQGEDALRESEERYRTLFEKSAEGILIADIETKKLKYANPALCKMLGYSQEELTIMGVGDIHPKDSLGQVFAEFDAQARGEKALSLAFPCLKKDGTIIFVDINTTKVNIGGRECNVGFFTDITERKEMEETLKGSEDKFSKAFNSSPNVITISRLTDGEILEVNNTVERLWGYSREEVVGKSSLALNLLSPLDRQRAVSLLEKQGFVREFELEVRRKSGDMLQVSLSIEEIEISGEQCMLTTMHDITERKQAEEALRSSEERLRIIFESVPEGIVLSDLRDKYLQVNEAMVRMLGFDDKKQMIGRNIAEFLSEDEHDKARKRRERAREFGPVKDAAVTLRRRDGSEFPAEVSVSAVRDASGKPIGFVTVVKDITERRRMEEQLMRADRMASIGELASGIAHELNNPLTGVIGFSELLLEKDVPEDIKEDLKVINREAQRAAQVVKNLLTFARKHPEEKQIIDIHSVIQGTLELRKYEHKVNNIQVITHLSPDLPGIMANDFQLQQVFLNIIVNAEFFMIEAHGKGALTITAEQVDNSIRVSFADDGPGIAPENLRKIFDPFFTTKEVGKGTGLGLSISYGIIAAHNGRIYAESQTGKGATFIVELPIPQK